MSALRDRLQADLTAAMKSRSELRTATLRMALAALQEESVGGKVARELNDADVLRVLTREAKKRREAAEAFAAAGRPELADRERAEGAVLAEYLPTQLDDDELASIVREVLQAHRLSGRGAMGPAMKAVNAAVAGRADGARVSAEVRRQLGTA